MPDEAVLETRARFGVQSSRSQVRWRPRRAYLPARPSGSGRGRYAVVAKRDGENELSEGGLSNRFISSTHSLSKSQPRGSSPDVVRRLE